MKYHSKDGIVYMVQVDHLTGEQIGYAVGRFYDAGASNVQVVSSLTKKNRPSYVIFIDCRQQYSEAVESLIPDELGAGGWHKIITEHHYLYNKIVELDIELRLEGHAPSSFIAKGKLFENNNLRPEHESVIELQDHIAETFGVYKKYQEVYSFISHCLLSPGTYPYFWDL